MLVQRFSSTDYCTFIFQQKRSLEDLPDVVPNKKQRISHHDKHQKRTNGKLADGDNNNHNSSNGAVTMATNSFGDKGSPGSNRENQEKGVFESGWLGGGGGMRHSD